MISGKKVKFTNGEVVWAIVMATATLLFSYTILIWFGVPNLPWGFENDSLVIIAVRAMSVVLIGVCVLFYPGDIKRYEKS